MKKSVVTFIDILGFADEVKALATTSSTERFNKVREKVISFVSHITVDSEPGEVVTSSFSDCIVRARIVKSGERDKDVLQEEVERIAKCQIWCQGDGFVVRGGMSLGNHFEGSIPGADGENIKCMISPALIEAHYLESRIAKYPRVVLSRSLVDRHKLQSLPFLKFDGVRDVYFIDYLLYQYLDNAELDDQIFEQHRDLIVDGLRNGNKKVRSKYRWMKSYHNRTLNELMRTEWSTNDAWQEQMTLRKYLSTTRKELPFLP